MGALAPRGRPAAGAGGGRAGGGLARAIILSQQPAGCCCCSADDRPIGAAWRRGRRTGAVQQECPGRGERAWPTRAKSSSHGTFVRTSAG